jgi:hypothetical protein
MQAKADKPREHRNALTKNTEKRRDEEPTKRQTRITD